MMISWVWKMRNDHYGVRKKARKHGKWSMKQDSVAWKFRTQKSDNIYSDFEDKFGALSGVHFIHTIYFFEDWEVMSPTLQRVCKSELKWRSYGHLKTTAPSWRVISKWFRNPLRNNTNFKFTHYHFDFSLPLPWELHLGTPSTLSGPYTTRNHHFIFYFKIIFRKLFCNKWPMRVCHMLGNWWYYINSFNSKF